jgi:putative protease
MTGAGDRAGIENGVPGRPEILAPAGDEAALAAALASGADAVYFGLDEGFNARARAANFPVAALPATVARIHRAGAKAYIAFNTLVFESELPFVEDLLRRIAAAGADALIVQDPAVALLARAICPALEVHGSTQMTVSSPAAAGLVADLGLTRVVVPRELSVDEIRAYAAGTDLELEVFVHGALCVSWSGQCLTSESWGGRSANRGQCAQSCRLPYDLVVDGDVRDLGDVAYLLSPKDLAGAAAVPDLAAIGVASLKIEGRQKSAAYVATATGGYRRWLDSVLAGAPDEAGLAADLATMEVAYSRGFSPGFLAGSDHQHLVEGRFPRHRGTHLGRVIAVDGDDVQVAAEPRPWTGGLALADRPAIAGADTATRVRFSDIDDRAGRHLEPRPGVGVAFDAGRPEDQEIGGPLFRVRAEPGGWRLGFGTPGPDLSRVHVGDQVWLTSDPTIARIAERATAAESGGLGRIALDLVVAGAAGGPLSVTARAAGHAVELASTSPLAAARGAGIDAALIADKLGALGGTPFRLGAVDTAALAPGLHLPVSELKDLRRRAVAALDAAIARVERVVADAPVIEAVRAAVEPPAVAAAADPLLVPLCRNDDQLDAALALGVPEVELDWMELVGLAQAAARARAAGARVVLATVRVQKPGEDKIDARLARLQPDAILVRSWGSLATFAALPAAERPVLHGDFSLNVTNAVTAAWALGRGLATVTAAHDLDAAQLAALIAAAPAGRVAVTAHHHMPTFHTEHCVYAHLLSGGRDYRSCGRPCEQHQVSLRDRVGLVHPVVVDVGCRNTVFDARAQSAPSLVPALLRSGVRRLRIELVRESRAEAHKVIAAWQSLVAGHIDAPEVLSRIRAHEQFGVTRGTMRSLAVLP